MSIIRQVQVPKPYRDACIAISAEMDESLIIFFEAC
ncbi:hypothetical protein PSYMO_06150 [Pseudomonas amygdali pv. mori str. 301020]|uniref:Uncharacterized protein n=2 Tax=Pseudomonas syringae group genomosp. 2 TaxID=251698 RepID=F3C4Q2_PSESG|nr:hypothetical protein Pgy4_13156 [Pseudomonas savastanoi pv. glycinea str. race 4]EGH21093.1 hypothetical protein PSYMO_06150 [Pseudomonas amygdali pv. mori str. 301020]